MRYPAGHRDRSRAGILAAAGRVFRQSGYAGIGIDGIANEAGVTSGAFYGHFRSKDEVFREAVRAALGRLHAGVLRFRGEPGAGQPEAWLGRFVEWYVGVGHRSDRAGGCGLPGLSGEVVRAGEETRAVFEAGLTEVARALSDVPPLSAKPDGETRALALLALLAGGVTLSRAVRDEAAADRIAAAVREATTGIVGS